MPEPLRLDFCCNVTMDTVFTPQPLRAVRVLFSLMGSGWVAGWWGKACPDCISETVRCTKLICDRDTGECVVGVQHHGVTLI